MASTASSSSASPTQNGTPAVANSSSASTQRTQAKATYSAKLGSADAKPRAGETSSNNQRQSPAPKAWQSGINPLTQNSTSSSQANGNSASPTKPANSGIIASLLREGLKVRITLDSMAEFEGIYSNRTESTYNLKKVTQKKLPGGGSEIPNGATRPTREQSTMSFQTKDVVDVHVLNSSLPKAESRSQNGNASSFRTDTAISGNRSQTERVLQRWVPDGPEDVDNSLESSRTKSSGAGGWDQFAENERLFGVTTDYDENIYTTTIDRSHPQYRQKMAEADKKAREIEGSAATNSHIAEERITDNISAVDGGHDEEDKYSGVRRQQDFPPLGSSSNAQAARESRYTPPAKRAPTGSSTVSGAPVDPAIISSQLARPDKVASNKSESQQPAAKPDASPAKVSTETKNTDGSAQEAPLTKKLIAPHPSTSASLTTSPQPATDAVAPGVPNATATVERDLATSFRAFAAQQRQSVDRMQKTKAKVDKEVRLNDLKRFAEKFKLDTPVPTDLVPIIAKDPVKQREIQEKAIRNVEQIRQAKAVTAEATKQAAAAAADPQDASRATTTTHNVPSSGGSSRQASSRGPGFPPQSLYSNAQNTRNDRSSHVQQPFNQANRPGPNLSTRLRNIEQSKVSHGPLPGMSGVDGRLPPTGPAGSADPNFSRRSSGVASASGAKLNPHSNEFRPNVFATTFNPHGNQSTASSPRSSVTAANTTQPIPTSNGSLLRRKPQHEPSASPKSYDILKHVKSIEAPAGKTWTSNGGVQPAYDTAPLWRQITDDERETSTMHQTYKQAFEMVAYNSQVVVSPGNANVNPQAPHQHQLPFHLQQGAHHVPQRQSPRQPPIHLNGQHAHGPNPSYNGPDDHRMIPSHSAQSYASPRLQQAGMAYPSPMAQPAQLAYNQIQYPMGPGGHQMAPYRSYSGTHHFMPQQAPHMTGPVMIQGPPGNAFIGTPQGMVAPAPQMIYPTGQGHFIPANGPPPSMQGSNGYPSPGRGAPMMVSQGSQQGQPMYGMSPSIPFGQPVYATHHPAQMPHMRNAYPPQNQHYGNSPQQMHHFPHQHRGPSNNYNKHYSPQNNHQGPSSHPQATNNTQQQNRQNEVGDEAK